MNLGAIITNYNFLNKNIIDDAVCKIQWDIFKDFYPMCHIYDRTYFLPKIPITCRTGSLMWSNRINLLTENLFLANKSRSVIISSSSFTSGATPISISPFLTFFPCLANWYSSKSWNRSTMHRRKMEGKLPGKKEEFRPKLLKKALKFLRRKMCIHRLHVSYSQILKSFLYFGPIFSQSLEKWQFDEGPHFKINLLKQRRIFNKKGPLVEL